MAEENAFLVEGPRVGIRPCAYEDAEEFTAGARQSKDLHHPWLFPPTDIRAFTAYAARLIEEADKAGFLVCTRDDGVIAGYISVNNIVEGAFRCAALGYGAFSHAVGRGLMTEGLGLVVGHAFTTMGLHRLEINVQPGNAPSIALARRLGFRKEGFSPDFLFINGAWRDHERWALTSEMPGATAAGTLSGGPASG
ncbi:GNAT family N-acetyltransferase [Streptomyces tsukubensis]|uniref:GNAT family N-acetyltransferase n=1 Tax=Streptomyces tsukubensis TaxID=83656 RepID=A0A1V4AE25_9ACTN|nr:GNAT family protein [Streptomyces tsukubensis]OON81749.1 GNAT family N-acetyltransferase [Streptomyces tsukubensis]QFR96526.1 GNAT family N-acetyltransferase [Streptomyces tsukubensis]